MLKKKEYAREKTSHKFILIPNVEKYLNIFLTLNAKRK